MKATSAYRLGTPSSRRGLALPASVLTAMALGWAAIPDPYGVAGRAVADEPKAAPLAAGEMVVTGRVLDADGKPVPGCQVALLTRYFRRSEKPEGTWPATKQAGLSKANRVSATGQTDGEGRFRLAGPGGYSAALPTLAAAVIASAPGHGLTAQRLDHALARQDVTVKLQPERVVRGRLVDAQGKPAAGAEVRVHIPPYPEEEVRGQHPTAIESRLSSVLGSQYCCMPPEGPFWPKPVVTDEQGRFFVRGLGTGKARLEARGDRIAPDRFDVRTADPEDKTEVTLRLASVPLLEGRVTEEGSGKPVAGARLIIMADASRIVETRTDKEGRYAVRPFPAAWAVRPNTQGKLFQVIAHPPEGSAGLVIRVTDIAMADKDRQELNLSLPVGVVLRGRVTEAGTGKPVAGARVQYRQRNADNPLLREGAAELGFRNTLFLEEGNVAWPVSTLEAAISGADGRFQMAVPHGPGHLFILGPALNYVPIETTLRELEGGKPGGPRYYPHAVVPLDLKPGVKAPEVTVTLRRGVTLRGRVVGPDGKPAAQFLVLCRSYIPSGWHQLYLPRNWVEGRDGSFELPGCDPDKAVTAHFWDRENGLGATAELSAKQTGDKEITVHLKPCGKAEVRCVGLDGKPLAGYRVALIFQFDPGTCWPLNFQLADRPIEANWFYWDSAPADSEGKATLTNLIPGATYLIHSRTGTGANLKDRWEPLTLISFTAKSGETSEVRVVEDNRPKASPYVDLQPKANQKLREDFHKSPDGNNIEELWRLRGNRPLGGAIFNIGEGLIHLANKNLKGDLPEQVEGIKVDAKFATLHVLHGTVSFAPDGTVIAKYVVRYDDRTTETIEVVYGRDVRDWWRRDGDKEPARGKVAWKGSNEAAKANGRSLWLFTLTWKNPHPDKKVVSIDCVSTLTDAAPFVVAMTLEGR
jgi:hypothetical protein